jgi:hypothetical protein
MYASDRLGRYVGGGVGECHPVDQRAKLRDDRVAVLDVKAEMTVAWEARVVVPIDDE